MFRALSLFLLLLITGCSKDLQQTLTPSPPLPETVAAPSRIEPAPAGYSKAEATRYYDAQLELIKLGTPRKVKNSNNTTIEQTQTIQTTNIWHLVLAAVCGFFAGFLMAFAIIVAKKDVRSLKLDPR